MGKPFTFIVDISLLLVGLILALYGALMTSSGWIFIAGGILLVSLSIIRSKDLRNFSSIEGLSDMKLKVDIDTNSCMGAASCVTLAPQVFKLDESSLKSSFMSSAPLVILDENGATNQTILDAAQTCPYKAILLKDVNTDEQVFP